MNRPFVADYRTQASEVLPVGMADDYSFLTIGNLNTKMLGWAAPETGRIRRAATQDAPEKNN